MGAPGKTMEVPPRFRKRQRARHWDDPSEGCPKGPIFFYIRIEDLDLACMCGRV